MSDRDDLAGRSVLVTGGAGFVGGALVRRLLRSEVGSVHVIDNLISSERVNVPVDPRVRFTEGSLADDHVVQGLSDDYDYVFHLVTYHGNQSSIHDPIADQEHNQTTTLKLFHRAKDFRRLLKLVYTGAGCAVAEKTYGEARATPEDAPISLHMDSPYSISKIVGEFYAVYFHSRHGLPTVRARFQNVYGPGEILGAGKWRGTPATVWRNVIPTFVYKALKGEALPLEAGGIATRDFIFVEDVARGLVRCALAGRAGEAYNIASGTETSIRELAERINDLTANFAPLELLPRRSWDSSGKRFGSTEKAKAELGFTAEVDLDEGLRRTVQWTRDNVDLIDACIAKHQEQMAAVQTAA